MTQQHFRTTAIERVDVHFTQIPADQSSFAYSLQTLAHILTRGFQTKNIQYEEGTGRRFMYIPETACGRFYPSTSKSNVFEGAHNSGMRVSITLTSERRLNEPVPVSGSKEA